MFVSVTLSTYLYTYLVSRSLKLEEAPTTGTQTVARINNFILANFKLWLLLLLFCCCCTKTTLNPSKKFDCVRKHLWALQIHISLSHTHSSLSLPLSLSLTISVLSRLHLKVAAHFVSFSLSLSLSLSCYPSLRLRAPACYNVVVICVHSRLGFMLNAFDDDDDRCTSRRRRRKYSKRSFWPKCVRRVKYFLKDSPRRSPPSVRCYLIYDKILRRKRPYLFITFPIFLIQT